MVKRRIIFYIIAPAVLLLSIIFLNPSDTEDLTLLNTGGAKTNSFAVYTKDGDIFYADKVEEVRKSIYNIVIKTDNFTVDSPVGIIENSPEKSIMDIYGIALESMNKDNNVLVIYIDGLGYGIYEEAVKSGNIPYIAALNMGEKAFTVYPPITDVTFASMVTGETPKYTGIHSREKKPLLVPTIFDIASGRGKTSKLIEGNMKILTDEVETVLNIDDNGNGTIDDEIYKSAMNALEKPPHLLMVHFHSYDDFAHKHGPGSDEALAQLKVLDSYIRDMVKDYEGDVIITADHGMHNEDGGGMHGTFSSTDIFIPIIRK